MKELMIIYKWKILEKNDTCQEHYDNNMICPNGTKWYNNIRTVMHQITDILHGTNKYTYFFSSPELKAQMRFSDRLLYVFCLFICYLFTFSSSSSKPICQYQFNLAQSFLKWRRFKFFFRIRVRPFPKGG